MYSYQTTMFPVLYDDFKKTPMLKKYYNLFKNLDLSTFRDANYGIGRTGYSQHAMIRALIFFNVENFHSIPKLIYFIEGNRALAELMGFYGKLPDSSQFYRFLKRTNNNLFKNLLYSVNKKLLDANAISLDICAIDSKPIKAHTKQNNPKNPNRNLSNKFKKPRRNPAATLSYYSYTKKNDGEKENSFFWGYRTHVIVSKEGIPLVELTLPNNIPDYIVAKILIRMLKRIYNFKKDTIFLADSAYDVKELYNLIVSYAAKPFIKLNPRGSKPPKSLSHDGVPLCDAGLEMYYDGIFSESKPSRTRLKFRCPLIMSKKIAKDFPDGCPIKHKRFISDKHYGCTKYIDITDDARARVPRSSQSFLNTYPKRIVVEEYFSRFGDPVTDKTTHFSFNSVRNQASIKHLSMALIALTAVKLDQKEKLRSYFSLAA